MIRPDDMRFMALALRLAARGLGRVAPNPAVGAVIVAGGGRAGRIIGRGWTQPGGRPHAETQALAQAREIAPAEIAGSTLYVTLEPCAHHGKTPPCAEAVVEAGIARVVIASPDPDPRVDGAGAAKLSAAGIEVVEGVRRPEGDALNAGFFKKVRAGLPFVTLKLATSLDGRIALSNGKSQWITGAEARAAGHFLRATHDAILVGRGTAEIDNPSLTCRRAGLEDRSPVRVVADRLARLGASSQLAATAHKVPVWLLVGADADASRCAVLAEKGVEVISIPCGADGRLDLRAGFKELASRGITRVLVEGGADLASSLVQADLIDRIDLFMAGIAIGGDGAAALGALGLTQLDAAPRFRLNACEPVGDDLHLSYSRTGV